MEISDNVNVPSSYQLKSRKKGFGRYQTTELVSLIESLEKAEEYREKQSAESGRRLFEDFASRLVFFLNECVTLNIFQEKPMESNN